jgi:hypothetical protein
VVDGEASRIDPGLRNGDWRGLLEKSGEGLYGVGVVDCRELVALTAHLRAPAYHCVECSLVLLVCCRRVFGVVLMTAPAPATRTQRFLQIALSYRTSVPPRIRRLVRAASHCIATGVPSTLSRHTRHVSLTACSSVTGSRAAQPVDAPSHHFGAITIDWSIAEQTPGGDDPSVRSRRSHRMLESLDSLRTWTQSLSPQCR